MDAWRGLKVYQELHWQGSMMKYYDGLNDGGEGYGDGDGDYEDI